MLVAYETDYRWLSQVYESVQPTSGNGKLLWHALGAKTIELIHQNVHVDAVRDDLDEIVLDADLLEARAGHARPRQEGAGRSRSSSCSGCASTWATRASGRCPSGWRSSRSGTKQGQLHSLEFLKQLLRPGHATCCEAEKETPPEEDEDRGKAALTELFEEVRNPETPIIVERIVADIDEIVRLVRFPGWQNDQRRRAGGAEGAAEDAV